MLVGGFSTVATSNLFFAQIAPLPFFLPPSSPPPFPMREKLQERGRWEKGHQFGALKIREAAHLWDVFLFFSFFLSQIKWGNRRSTVY